MPYLIRNNTVVGKKPKGISKDGEFKSAVSVDGEPKGAGGFRGSAGVLAKGIEMLRDSSELMKVNLN